MTTCARCDTTWTALTWAHCGSCHRLFSGVTYFDLHRKDGSCVIPSGLYEDGGVFSTAEGHQQRKERSESMARIRGAK